MKILQLITLLLSLTLTACVNLPTSDLQQPLNQTLSWQAREKQLHAFTTWTVSGAIAVKNTDAKEGGQFRFAWQERQGQYDIDFTAPLGGLVARVHGGPGEVTLQKSNGDISRAKTPEAILASELGWYFPVSYLKYWIRGLPAPGQAVKQFDEHQHLARLTQQGWDIHFERYTHQMHVDVPAKMILSRPPLQVRMVITSWGD